MACIRQEGVYEVLSHPSPIEGVVSGTAGFASGAGGSELDTPELLTSTADCARCFGEAPSALGRMVLGFFENGGTRAYVAGALAALEIIDDVELLCPLPEDNTEAIAQCERRRDRFAILSLPVGLGSIEEVLAARPPEASAFAAVHHPWVFAGGESTPPGGHVAAIYASTDSLLAAPTERDVRGLDDPPLELPLSERELAILVKAAINPLRDLRATGGGVRVWAARSLSADQEWQYVPVRRTMIFLESSLMRGLGWVVFEPNDEALWRSVRKDVEAFLRMVWRTGTLKGRTPEEAFFVRCDRTTMTQQDLDDGRLTCVIGAAVVRPAEFVILRLGQWTADRCV